MSRWGNFLQGIESGLDKILAEDENRTHDSANPNQTVKATTANSIHRHDSSKRKPDRLRERLARAVDGQNSEGKRTGLDSNKNTEYTRPERNSSESFRDAFPRTEGDQTLSANGTVTLSAPLQDDTTTQTKDESEVLNSHRESFASDESANVVNQGESAGDAASGAEEERKDAGELSEGYLLERIDALQAKLDIFIQEAAERARSIVNTSPDAQSRKLAQQEEKLATLMAEGQTLSRRELRHLSTIRRLHARIDETEMLIDLEKKASSDYQRNVQSLKLKIESLENDRVSSSEESEGLKRLEKELEQAQRRGENQASELKKLRQEVENANLRDSRNKSDEIKRSLDAEKRLTLDLREELEGVRIEQELLAGKHRTQLEEERSKCERERERSSVRETELQNEVRMLESRLETIRSRTEEVSGGPADDMAKQLRQIEALQRQYSVSKDNWNGIEASLNSRISSLELERDEVLRKETEFRKKLKEAVVSSRKQDARLDDLMASNFQLEEELRRIQSDSAESRAALTRARNEAEQLKGDLKKAQQMLAEKVEKADVFSPGDRAGASLPVSPYERAPSPFAIRKPPPGLDIRDRRSQNGSAHQTSLNTPQERPTSSRKVSLASPYFPPHLSGRQQSLPSATRSSSRSAARDAHSISAEDHVEHFDDIATPATPGRAFGTVLSASATTPSVGPSVQLVERMTSAVRRLESEKAATRDELDRLSSERDENRKQVASLLEEVEAKRLLEKRVDDLENQVSETTQKYQTTLELLGEKSETVEELKADIADMKQIYREALEGSLK